jgi:Ca-activated chloride channel homolog
MSAEAREPRNKMRRSRIQPASIPALVVSFSIVCSIVGGVSAVNADSDPSHIDQQEQPVRLGATLVTVPIIASDRDGRYITDMRREEFTISEDGTKQEIAFFATVNEPSHVILMLDVSASAQEKLGQIKTAATTFVSQLKSVDRVKVISFDDEIHDLSGFTNDRAELADAISKAQPGKGTKLYDAMEFALRQMKSVEGRKAIVLFTDGVDRTSDGARYKDNTNAIEESGILVYPIRYDTRAETEAMLRQQEGLGGVIQRPPVGTTPPTTPGGERGPEVPPIGGPTTRDPRIPPTGSPFPGVNVPGSRPPDVPERRDPRDSRFPNPDSSGQRRFPGRNDSISRELDQAYAVGNKYLSEIAAKSGGKIVPADTLYNLPAAFAQIAAELRTQYAIGYYPTNPAKDGGYRKIQVRTSRKNVMLRARPGYRASTGT